MPDAVSVFPTALDTFPIPRGSASGGTDDLNTPGVIHGAVHQLEGSALTALEVKVGINGSADTNSLDYKSSLAILKNGLTTTTALIPFLHGWSSASDCSLSYVDPRITFFNQDDSSQTILGATNATGAFLQYIDATLETTTTLYLSPNTVTLSYSTGIASVVITTTAMTFAQGLGGGSLPATTFTASSASGGSNLNGSSFELKPGSSTGTGASGVDLYGSDSGGSGSGVSAVALALRVRKTTVTFSDGVNMVFNTTTGTKIGTSTSQKLAFYNSTPIVQPGATTDLGTVLSNLGLRAAGTAYTITTSGAASFSGTFGSSGVSSFTNSTDSTSNTTGGVKLSGGLGVVKNIYAGGNIAMDVLGKALLVKEGSGGMQGRATMSSGVATVTITGLTSNDHAFINLQATGGTLGARAKAVCTTDTLTITSVGTTGVTNTLETSTYDYFITRPA